MLYSFDSAARLASVAHAEETDEQLMLGVQRADGSCLEELHRRHGGNLLAVVMRVLHNEHSAEDLLQEVFLEVWRLADRYSEEKGKALGWMITLARRRAIDRLRREQAYGRVEERFQKESEHRPEAWSCTQGDIEVEAADLRRLLDGILETLPPAQKLAVELAYYKGMSQREIALHTQLPLGTIKTRLELGVRKIASKLKDVLGERESPFCAS